MKYVSGFWEGTWEISGLGALSVSVEGDSRRPDHRMLEKAHHLLKNIQEIRAAAVGYIKEHDREFLDGNGELVLESIEIYKTNEKFDLSFGFADWPDGFVTAHFVGSKPVELSHGD